MTLIPPKENNENVRKANILLDKKEYKKAYEIYLEEAKKGNYLGQYNVAKLYDLGLGVNKDSEKALAWYLASAYQKYNAAMNKVASMYFLGEYVEQDYFEAYKWLKKEIDETDGTLIDDSTYEMISYCYENGKGTEKNLEKANRYKNR